MINRVVILYSKSRLKIKMDLIEIIVLIIFAAVIGAFGQLLTDFDFKSGNFFISTLIGFMGAFIGIWVVRLYDFQIILPITFSGKTYPLIWILLSTSILVIVIGSIKKIFG